MTDLIKVIGAAQWGEKKHIPRKVIARIKKDYVKYKKFVSRTGFNLLPAQPVTFEACLVSPKGSTYKLVAIIS